MANYRSSLTGSQMDDALSQMNNRVPEGWAVGERDGVPVGEESLYYHNNAKYYAEQAQAQAESAEESAESASQVAQETADAVIAQAFVQESATAGSIVTIDDGADNIPLKDLKVNLAINQPLHGQANPYPAGGGKNKLPNTATSKTENGITFTVNSDGSVKVTGTATATTYLQLVGDDYTLANGSYILNGSVGGVGNTYNMYVAYKESGGGTLYITSANGDSPVWTVTDNTDILFVAIRIYSGATVNTTFYPMLRLSTESADYAPYSNICPIYPVTEAEVRVSGKNLFVKSLATQGVRITNTGEIVTASTYYLSDYIKVEPSADYFFTNAVGGSSFYLGGAFDEYFNFLSALSISGATPQSKKLTMPANAHYVRINVVDTYVDSFQMEKGSTGTPYAGSAGQQYLVNIGINQWDEEWELGAIAIATGANTSSSTIIRSKNICPCAPNAEFYLGEYVSTVFWYDANNGYIGYDYNNATGNKRTSPANAHGFRIITKSSYGTTYNNNISINYPSRFTSDYHAYTGNVVYGGELDVTTGVLTARYKSVTWNGTENWGVTTTGNYYRYQLSVSDIKNVGATTTAAIIADKLATTIANEPYTVKQYNQLAWIIMPNTVSTVEQFKAWLAENPIQAVYELATPITIQLTPTEVDTLRGDNVIWADCGDITNCEYRADLKMYIDKVVG